jgi:hypothetical protein
VRRTEHRIPANMSAVVLAGFVRSRSGVPSRVAVQAERLTAYQRRY